MTLALQAHLLSADDTCGRCESGLQTYICTCGRHIAARYPRHCLVLVSALLRGGPMHAPTRLARRRSMRSMLLAMLAFSLGLAQAHARDSAREMLPGCRDYVAVG